jgi:uncharacterized protein (DUF58 family)
VSLPGGSAFQDALPARFRRWALRRQRDSGGSVRLDRSRVFILPTRAGVLFGVVALSIWFTSLNFNLQLGYFLAFLVMSVALVAMYETHRNLIHLELRELRCAAVHAGEVADFEFAVGNPADKARYAVHLEFILPRRRRAGPGRALESAFPGVLVDIAASSSARVRIGLPTRRRGRRECPRVRISTRFPFGLWEAWAYASPTLSTLVYPQPEDEAPPPPRGSGDESAAAAGALAGTEDFAGVRPYRPGDPLRSVAWRLAARSDELSVKVFEASAGEEILLEFDRLPAALGVEQRLSRLTRWILDADAAGLRYALLLPGQRIGVGNGTEQRQRCLEALALEPVAGEEPGA